MRRCIVEFSLACLLPTAVATAQAASPAPSWNLARFQSAAERTYPGLRAARSRIRAAQARLDEAWVSPFFQSTVTAGVTLSPEARGHPIFSPDPQVPLSNPWAPVFNFQVEGAIPLFTFGKLPFARDAARAGIDAARAEKAQVRAKLLFDVRRAYFGLQLALDLQQMLGEAMPRIDEARDQLSEQLEAGEAGITEMDQWRLEAAIAELDARAADVDRLERSSRAALGILTGVERFQLPDCPIEPVSFTLEAAQTYVALALGGRPEVSRLRAGRRAREAGLKVASSGALPDIAFAYRFGTAYAPGITDQLNPFVIDPANYLTVFAGILARWSLDVWGNAYRVERQQALLDDLRARSSEAERGIQLEVQTAYERVRGSRTQQEAWARSRRQTRAWFIASTQAYQIGTLETQELVDAVKAYLNARSNHLFSIREYNTSLADLERSAGTQLVDTWERACE